jgi:hypothetical protein
MKLMKLIEELGGELVPFVMERPICLNGNCDNLAQKKNKNRYSPFCRGCNDIYAARGIFPPHIEPVKKFRCENEDGKLGFPCLVNWTLVEESGASISTHIDHIDGNHMNNTPENTMELCPLCHNTKSKMNGDYHGYKY